MRGLSKDIEETLQDNRAQYFSFLHEYPDSALQGIQPFLSDFIQIQTRQQFTSVIKAYFNYSKSENVYEKQSELRRTSRSSLPSYPCNVATLEGEHICQHFFLLAKSR